MVPFISHSGLNKQWGKTISGNNVKTKFPIAFTAFCMLSVSVNSSNGNAAESVFRNGFGYTNKTLSDWILRGPTGDATYFADYIAIGCQPQWGASGYAVTFPIAFNVVYNVLSIPQTTASTSNAYWGRFYITALTKNGFNVSDTGAGSNRWIAIGSAQPQWGFTNNTGRPYITFPFKFSNVFTAISCICHNGSPSEANTVYNVSISGMNIGASGGGSGKYWCAFGVAQPQWGYGNSESTQTFPIKFTNSVIGIYGSKRAINYEYTFAATSITNTNFFMSTRNSEGNSRVIACNWLAIGQQQTK